MSTSAVAMKTSEWRTVKLGDVLTLYYGKALPKPSRNPSGKIPVYGANGIKDHADKPLCEGPTLIIGRKGSAGEITRVEGPFWPLDVTYYTSHDRNQLDFDYMVYALSMLDLPSLARGVKPGINRNDVYALEVQLPPLDEQRRIVAVLDQAFAALDRARAHAEANLADAKSLFEASIRSRFETGVTEFGSIELRELAEHVTDGDHQPPPKVVTGVPFITISNIDKDSRGIDFSNTFYVSKEYFQGLSDKRRAKMGDILYTVTGSFGIPVLVTDQCGNFCFQRHIGLIRPKAAVDSNWLRYMLDCPQVYEQANGGATGTAQRTVSLKVLRGLRVPDLPESRQRAVGKELDILWDKRRAIAASYAMQLADLAALRQSLLQKAFAGQLS